MTAIFPMMPANYVTASQDYAVTVNDQEVFVYPTAVGSYAVLSAEGEQHVRVTTKFAFHSVQIRPLHLSIEPIVEGRSVSFELSQPCKVVLEFDGDLLHPLFLLINPPETEKPDPEDHHVHYFAAGRVHEVGQLVLRSGETVYIEEGAVVRGTIFSERSNHVSISGRGILDASGWRLGAKGGLNPPSRDSADEVPQPVIQFINCHRVLIEGITVVDGPSWHVVPTASTNVRIRDLNIITENGTGDGVDVVGCKNVDITNCFIRSKDDCIALKAVDYHHPDGCRNVEHIRVRDCVLWNAQWGNAIEIGYETQCDEIHDVVVQNCDILHCEFEGYQSGGVFTIHNGDRAIIHNVLYEDIRVEDAQEKLIDQKILRSKYSHDEERGQIRNIRYRNISVLSGAFPVSIIQGYDSEHMVNGVTIDNLTVHGDVIKSAIGARMVVELARQVHFRAR